MNKKNLIILCLIVISLSFVVYGITYDYDSVEVLYAAEFTANPVSVSEDNWLAEIAGGIDNNLTVTYGIVSFMNEGEPTGDGIEFIKVKGEGGLSERFIVNGWSAIYYGETATGVSPIFQVIDSQFWTAKELVDYSIVKDFTPPIKSLVVRREFDETQNLHAVSLWGYTIENLDEPPTPPEGVLMLPGGGEACSTTPIEGKEPVLPEEGTELPICPGGVPVVPTYDQWLVSTTENRYIADLDTMYEYGPSTTTSEPVTPSP